MIQQKSFVWLDCDPGLDDCFAIILAAGHPRLNLIGVSTCGGNTSVQNTTRNALDVLFHIGKSQVPVYMGSKESMSQGTLFAPEVHGEKGLGGVELIQSKINPITQNSFEEMRKKILAVDGKIAWINTGALTNLALLIQICPEILRKISLVSLMGGAVGKGNKTPAAEFNIYFDPQAAKIVFESGLNIAMVPLQVTHTALVTDNIFYQMQKKKSQMGKILVDMLLRYKAVYQTQGLEFSPLHDPCAVFYVLEPEKFVTKRAQVTIDTYPISLGRTNCQFRAKLEETNVTVCLEMNVPRFWEVMLELYKELVPNE